MDVNHKFIIGVDNLQQDKYLSLELRYLLSFLELAPTWGTLPNKLLINLDKLIIALEDYFQDVKEWVLKLRLLLLIVVVSYDLMDGLLVTVLSARFLDLPLMEVHEECKAFADVFLY